MTLPVLVILAAPRSFSSVVGAMIGQHPDLYGLPETNLFTADSVNALLAGYRMVGDQARHGLLRTLAQLHDQQQTVETIEKAQDWLYHHGGWSTREVFEHVREHVCPKIPVEKSPRLVRRSMHLERVLRMYPDAFFLHLTRHPRTTAQSQIKITSRNDEWGGRLDASKIKPQNWWEQCQQTITGFTSRLAVGQCMRIKGEDLLSNPDVYLPQIAEWLGVRTDRKAIEAMKHPEHSPYACMGPDNARLGNDINFQQSPHLRSGTVAEGLLQGPLEWMPDQTFSPGVVRLARLFGYR